MRTLLLCFFIAAATNGQAHEVDNIDYELRTDGTAWVKNGTKAQGDVTILSKIEVDGKEYTVVGIDYYAFYDNKSITSAVLTPKSASLLLKIIEGICILSLSPSRTTRTSTFITPWTALDFPSSFQAVNSKG
mgnify:CR=1 FL=1